VLTDGQKTIVYGRQGALYPVIVPMDGMIHTVADSFLQIEVKYLGEADASPALIVRTTGKIVALDAIAIIADCDSGYASCEDCRGRGEGKQECAHFFFPPLRTLGSNVRSRCELVHISECKFLRSESGQSRSRNFILKGPLSGSGQPIRFLFRHAFNALSSASLISRGLQAV
jgi:hypothetical protein